jgi:hypothetical protein
MAWGSTDEAACINEARVSVFSENTRESSVRVRFFALPVFTGSVGIQLAPRDVASGKTGRKTADRLEIYVN